VQEDTSLVFGEISMTKQTDVKVISEKLTAPKQDRILELVFPTKTV
jgi:hypothetical protein